MIFSYIIGAVIGFSALLIMYLENNISLCIQKLIATFMYMTLIGLAFLVEYFFSDDKGLYLLVCSILWRLGIHYLNLVVKKNKNLKHIDIKITYYFTSFMFVLFYLYLMKEKGFSSVLRIFVLLVNLGIIPIPSPQEEISKFSFNEEKYKFKEKLFNIIILIKNKSTSIIVNIKQIGCCFSCILIYYGLWLLMNLNQYFRNIQIGYMAGLLIFFFYIRIKKCN